jgi:hypothetical protein
MSKKYMDEIADSVHLGHVGALRPDWRQVEIADDIGDEDEGPDDEEAPCPADVKLILGFDPDEEFKKTSRLRRD